MAQLKVASKDNVPGVKKPLGSVRGRTAGRINFPKLRKAQPLNSSSKGTRPKASRAPARQNRKPASATKKSLGKAVGRQAQAKVPNGGAKKARAPAKGQKSPQRPAAKGGAKGATRSKGKAAKRARK